MTITEFSVAWSTTSGEPYTRRITETAGRRLTRLEAECIAYDLNKSGIPAKVESREIGGWR